MSNVLTDDNTLYELLPPSLQGVDVVADAANAISPQLKASALLVPRLFLWLRLLKTAGITPPQIGAPFDALLSETGLEPLSTEILEQLAKQLHVDFRDVATNDRQLAGMVANSIAWHRIKGTPASIKAALELCGFTGITIEEDGTGALWATYQLGLDAVSSIEDLKRIKAICDEMQPARCRLWRVYTSEYDFRPGIWSGRDGWSEVFWSDVSGLKETGIESEDRDVIVSFGITNRFRAEGAFDDKAAGVGLESVQGMISRYIDCARWSDCNWGDLFVQNHGFTYGSISSFLFGAEPYYHSSSWSGEWSGPWVEVVGWDRKLPEWQMVVTSFSKSSAVWSEEQGWSDLDSFWSGGSALILNTAQWGDLWSDGSAPESVIVDEFDESGHKSLMEAVNPPAQFSIIHRELLTGSIEGHAEGWGADSAISQQLGLTLDSPVAENVQSLISTPQNSVVLIDYDGAQNLDIGQSSALPAGTAPLHNTTWSGSVAGRTWYDYIGIFDTSETEEENS